MSKAKNNPEKEIKALAALKDADIDTSAIPEVKDWSNALKGQFCRHIHRQVTVLLDNNVPSWPSVAQTRIRPSSVASVAAGDCTQMDNRQLIAELSMKNDMAATEFVRRFHRLILKTAIRAAHRFGNTSPSLIDDLVQEVFLKIFTFPSRIWKDFRMDHESAVLGMIRTIAENVTEDYFRAVHSHKRGSETTDPVRTAYMQISRSSTETFDRDILFKEIYRILKDRTSNEDRRIFWLYYWYGFTALEISRLPGVNLSVEKIEKLLAQMITLSRKEMTVPGRSWETASNAAAENLALGVLHEEISQLLKNSMSNKDREMIGLYFRQDLTAKQISGFPGVKFSAEKIETLLTRMSNFLERERMPKSN